MKRRKAVAPQDNVAVLIDRIGDLEDQVRNLTQTGPHSVQPDDWERTVAPSPFELMLHWPNGGHQEAWTEDNYVYYHPGSVDPITEEEIPEGWKRIGGPVVEKYKVFADTQTVIAKTEAFWDMVTLDLDRAKLIKAAAFLPYPAGGPTEIQVWNNTRNHFMLEDPIRIDGGEQTSRTSAFPVKINLDFVGPIPQNQVFVDEVLRIDVISASGGKGLAVHLTFI